MTRKRPDRLPRSCVWLVCGEGRPLRYFLNKVFLTVAIATSITLPVNWF
jgi:hypothetical protein